MTFTVNVLFTCITYCDAGPELENGGVLASEHYVLSYVQVALATSDVQSILDIPATDEIHMEDRNHGLA